jgi:hypothetical protein
MLRIQPQKYSIIRVLSEVNFSSSVGDCFLSTFFTPIFYQFSGSFRSSFLLAIVRHYLLVCFFRYWSTASQAFLGYQVYAPVILMALAVSVFHGYPPVILVYYAQFQLSKTTSGLESSDTSSSVVSSH